MGGMIRSPFSPALASSLKFLSLSYVFFLSMLYLVDLCAGIVSCIGIHSLIDYETRRGFRRSLLQFFSRYSI